jgi:hypothetical protein
MQLLIMQFTPVFCYFLALTPEYLPHLKNRSLFFPQCDRPTFMSIHNRQHYCSVYYNLSSFIKVKQSHCRPGQTLRALEG